MSLHTAGEELSAKTIIIFSCCALAATLFGGLMSGLTVGLASLDRLSLEIDAKGDEAARKSAEKIFPIIDKHHWMLVTLLLCNAAAMESLPLFLDVLLPSWAAIVVSVTAVLMFGEILPQAICTGPN
jgi:metal transporter CNNM